MPLSDRFQAQTSPGIYVDKPGRPGRRIVGKVKSEKIVYPFENDSSHWLLLLAGSRLNGVFAGMRREKKCPIFVDGVCLNGVDKVDKYFCKIVM